MQAPGQAQRLRAAIRSHDANARRLERAAQEVEGVGEGTAVSEIERYAVWPGQALGYKLGMLKILELRAEAQERLGDKFDMRVFNDTVLQVASTPLPYIEATVHAWIEQAEM